jgi:hypothetical protein
MKITLPSHNQQLAPILGVKQRRTQIPPANPFIREAYVLLQRSVNPLENMPPSAQPIQVVSERPKAQSPEARKEDPRPRKASSDISRAAWAAGEGFGSARSDAVAGVIG